MLHFSLWQMIEIKMKKLIKFPPTIPAATAEELLQNLPWLNKDSTQIQFIKVEQHISQTLALE